MALTRPVIAGDLQASIAREARRAAASSQSAGGPQGRNELLMPGLAVAGVGTAVLLYGLVHETGVECSASANLLSTNCGVTKSKGVIIAGLAIAGTGGFLIWKGNKDRKARPEIVPTIGGALVRQRFRW
jgi:hypothetical protein